MFEVISSLWIIILNISSHTGSKSQGNLNILQFSAIVKPFLWSIRFADCARGDGVEWWMLNLRQIHCVVQGGLSNYISWVSPEPGISMWLRGGHQVVFTGSMLQFFNVPSKAVYGMLVCRSAAETGKNLHLEFMVSIVEKVTLWNALIELRKFLLYG